MSAHDKKMLDREAVRSVIQQWNANRLDLFALSEPDENLLFHGVMRFYFQDAGQKIATKCIRVASDATVSDVIDTLIEKFRPDMRMLSVPNYALYEVHSNGEERRLNPDEKPLLVQLNWHIDDREGRFLLKNIDQKTTPIESSELNFKRKLSKREKKEQKKKEKLAKLNSDADATGVDENHVAERLYTELPETSFTRSISNPEAVMRRRRQQKLEKKLQQFRSRDGGPDTGGTLKIYGESLCQDVPYKTLLLSIRDCAQAVVREMLAKYGLDKTDPLHYCLVQVNSDGTEYILDDDECPLSILMNHPTSRGSIMFHVRRRPADTQPRRRKKKPLGVSNGSNSVSSEREGPMLVEVTHSGDGGRRIKLSGDPVEVGSANTNSLQLFGPSIQPRHCLISLTEGVCTVTPLHADALTFVNGHHITQPTILHNGSVVMFGRVASYRFVDSPSDGRYNLALSQSQLDSACLYESRSPTSATSWNDEDGTLSGNIKTDFDKMHPSGGSNANNGGGVVGSSEHSVGMSLDEKTRSITDNQGRIKETEFTYDPEGTAETETKSLSSVKSGGSNNNELRVQKFPEPQQGQESILPAVLEFPETHQESFLRHVITELDVNAPNFKLAPVYTLYLCARYRASTHYRPELQPTERAHKLTIFLHHVSNLIYSTVQEQYTDSRILAFWMANSSEFLHFLKSDRHISAFSIQAQEVLAESVQTAFRNLVHCFRMELSQTLNQFLSETIDHDSAAGLVLTVLGSAMALLRRCRVNAALTIQLFSQLFHYINVICFNTIVSNSHLCTSEWGKVMTERLQLLELWAERQGLELAADCHLAKINQCAQFLQAPKATVEEIQQLACSCFRLNSLQMAALLQSEKISRNLVDTAIRMAESVADELTRADGREIRLEESPELHLALLLPDDGFSCDVVRGIPPGLVDFLNPLQASGMCRLAAQPTSVGLWTVYMHQFNTRSPSSMSNKLPQPEVQIIKLHKNSNGMGLSIVAAKGAGQERLGIYIKSVVPGGAADADGRLQAGDQLLRVDGQSLIGITQERAADFLVRTGPVVTLEVAKQGAIYHGLATLLQQPSPVIQRGNRRMSERDISRIGGGDPNATVGPLISNLNLPNSKSVPALHHSGSNMAISNNSKSRSTHSLIHNSNEQGFYQNLSIYRAQNNQRQPMHGERPQMLSHMHSGSLGAIGQQQQQQQQLQQQQSPMANTLSPTAPNNPNAMNQHPMQNRPSSAYYNDAHAANTNSLSMPSPNAMMSPYNHTHSMSASSSQLNGNMTMNPMQQNSLTLGNRSKSTQNFPRELQGQMQGPSMPNIAGSHSEFAGNVPTMQSMQNVNMIGQGHPPVVGGDLHIRSSSIGHSLNHNAANEHQRLTAAQIRGQGKIVELGEAINRRNQSQDMGIHTIDESPHHPHHLPPKPGMMHSPNVEQTSPVKGPFPPTAPKPQAGRTQLSYNMTPHQPATEETPPPPPPTTTHPLFKPTSNANAGPNYVASSLDPPKVAYYPVAAGSAQQQQHQQSKNYIGANPWEREEREKEHEVRREHVRQWREQQISELSSIMHRTPQQEEQLKTLILERDFERRAQEVDDPEDDNELPYEKEKIQEVIRLANQSNSMQTPITNFRQVEVKIAEPESQDTGPETFAKPQQQQQTFQPYPTLQSQIVPTPTVQPKSILKNNRYDGVSANNNTPSSPSKSQKSTSFADDRTLHNMENNITQLSRDLESVDISNDNGGFEYMKDSQQPHKSPSQYLQSPIGINNSAAPPPPPPERNSSYLVMSQQQQKIRNSASSLLKPAQPSPSDSLNSNTLPATNFTPPTSTGSGKRVNMMLSNNNVNDTMLPSPSYHSQSPAGIPSNNIISSSTSNVTTHHQHQQQHQHHATSVMRDNKRVSFHDEENNFIPSSLDLLTEQQQYQMEETDLEMLRKDPRFMQDTTAILQSPTSPDATDTWNTTVQSTPGVIGAQEVYRDPRQRRLQEAQQKKQQNSTEAVPEKLSFKEKMKMFALESGEDQTPKDKLKISRAQRDIDAVH